MSTSRPPRRRKNTLRVALDADGWVSDLVRTPEGHAGILTLQVRGLAIGVHLEIVPVCDPERQEWAQKRGWPYVVASSPEEAGRLVLRAKLQMESELTRR